LKISTSFFPIVDADYFSKADLLTQYYSDRLGGGLSGFKMDNPLFCRPHHAPSDELVFHVIGSIRLWNGIKIGVEELILSKSVVGRLNNLQAGNKVVVLGQFASHAHEWH